MKYENLETLKRPTCLPPKDRIEASTYNFGLKQKKLRCRRCQFGFNVCSCHPQESFNPIRELQTTKLPIAGGEISDPNLQTSAVCDPLYPAISSSNVWNSDSSAGQSIMCSFRCQSRQDGTQRRCLLTHAAALLPVHSPFFPLLSHTVRPESTQKAVVALRSLTTLFTFDRFFNSPSPNHKNRSLPQLSAFWASYPRSRGREHGRSPRVRVRRG